MKRVLSGLALVVLFAYIYIFIYLPRVDLARNFNKEKLDVSLSVFDFIYIKENFSIDYAIEGVAKLSIYDFKKLKNSERKFDIDDIRKKHDIEKNDTLKTQLLVDSFFSKKFPPKDRKVLFGIRARCESDVIYIFEYKGKYFIYYLFSSATLLKRSKGEK